MGSSGKIDTLALYEAGRNAGQDATADRIVTGEEALKLYERLMREMKCLKELTSPTLPASVD